jgi:hypothetical protein
MKKMAEITYIYAFQKWAGVTSNWTARTRFILSRSISDKILPEKCPVDQASAQHYAQG